jgi:hypothetical protein
MMSLEDHQRGLLNLIKSRGAAPTDAYLRQVAASPGLAVVRETALFWRAFQLQSQCPFTCRLLKRLGCFEALLADYFSMNSTSPYVEELSKDFLRWLLFHDNALIGAVSQFEYAALQAKADSGEVFEILWDRDPDSVLLALQNDSELPGTEESCTYRVRIDRNLSSGISCSRQRTADPSFPFRT